MSNENKIRILYVQPGKYPEERFVANELRPLQQLVGGDTHSREPAKQGTGHRTNQLPSISDFTGTAPACANHTHRPAR